MNEHDDTLRIDDEMLAAYVDGRLTPAEREAVDAHLATHPDDRAMVADLAAVDVSSDDVASEALADRIVAAWADDTASREGRPSMQRSAISFQYRALLAAAAVLIAVGVFVFQSGDDDDTDALARDGTLPIARGAGDGDTVPPGRLPEAGSERYVAHVALDKPIYRSGDKLFARAAVLDGLSHKPVGTPRVASFEVVSPKGEVLGRFQSSTQHGIAAFGWDVPEGIPGGEYTLKTDVLGLPATTTTFDVRAYRVPRLKTEIDFVKKAYGPGDAVIADLEVERAEGGIPVGAAVTAVARVDGVEVHREALKLDGLGRTRVGFDLPVKIENGDGTLAFVVTDGGTNETASKSIPIVVARVDLDFFPEGGDLVAGLPCGLYFEARTPRDKPADVVGRILDDKGRLVARFESSHEGRGRAMIVPKAGRTYRAVIDHPAGVETDFALPAIRDDGFSLYARADAFEAEEAVRVAVASTETTAATVGLYVKSDELALVPVALSGGRTAEVTLPTPTDVAGVLRVTVFDAKGTPRAERLVFHRPEQALNIALEPESATTIPGGKVRVNVKATDDLGRPVQAVVSVAATDDAVLTMPERRERAPRLDAQALLGAEVSELKDAGAYLGGDTESDAKLDLLLGTQGWRRFWYVDRKAFFGTNKERGLRAIALNLVLDSRVTTTTAVPADATAYNYNLLVIDALDGFDLEQFAELTSYAGRDNAVRFAHWARNEAEPDGGARAHLRDQVEVVLKRIKFDQAGGAVPPGMREPQDPVPPPPPQGPAGGKVAALALLVENEKAVEELARKLELRIDRFGLVAGDRIATIMGVPDWAREYAHDAPEGRAPGERSDFTETVYWNAGLLTDAEGRATIEFDAADSITTLKIRADGFTTEGALSVGETTVEVKRPLFVEPKCPLEVTAGDRIHLPLSIMNGTSNQMVAQVDMVVGDGLRLAAEAATSVVVAADSSVRHVLPVDVLAYQGNAALTLKVTADAFSDTVIRTVKVVPKGFPIEHAFGGVLERRVMHEIVVPTDVDASSLVTEAAVYPTPLASLTDALAALLREPGGCFEQTSSSNYPNVMILQYLASHSGVDPALLERTQGLLKRGYDRLVVYECKEKGFEWFGGDPGHEALTAYGVLEFHDMSKVMQVDPEMLDRTRTWLLARRDGKGGFKRNSRALDSFGRAPQEITDAYIVWALLEAGERDLEPELDLLETRAKASEDSYLLALAGNALWLAGRQDAARRAMKRLAEAQKDGEVTGASTSITRSGGRSLAVEATSLAILGWLRAPEHTRNVESAMRWLSTTCQNGRFGSTQATILALRAIIAYDTAHASPKAPGVVKVLVDGEAVSEQTFEAGREGAIEIPNLAKHLTPGRHEIEFVMEGGADMPYAFTVQFNADTPATSDKAAVSIATALSTSAVPEGEPVDVNVTVTNKTSEGVPMVVAVVGLPGGVEPRVDQLKELVKEGRIDAYELLGREIALYWRSMAPDAVHEVPLSCIATVPGTYEGPASRAYLYYTDEDKHWTEGLSLEIE